MIDVDDTGFYPTPDGFVHIDWHQHITHTIHYAILDDNIPESIKAYNERLIKYHLPKKFRIVKWEHPEDNEWRFYFKWDKTQDRPYKVFKKQ